MSRSQFTALERLEQCQSVEDMLRAFPSRDDRFAPFDDPVIARLYDALLASDRASMIKSATNDFCAAIGRVKKGAHFVDVGCGSGRTLLDLAGRFSQSKCAFVGVDPSVEMIAIAKENYKRQRNPKNVSFLCGHLNNVLVAKRTQNTDYMIIRNTVSWMADSAAELRIWLERLKPGGQIMIREIRRDAFFPLLKARVRRCLAFKAGDLTLAYPPSAMVAAYRSALTVGKLVAILNRFGITITIERPRKHDDVTAEPWGVDMFLVGEKARD
jgi:ubiquinone/menaquinone biosynthesis C-methylase UbiE